jgi:hypothetical protein
LFISFPIFSQWKKWTTSLVQDPHYLHAASPESSLSGRRLGAFHAFRDGVPFIHGEDLGRCGVWVHGSMVQAVLGPLEVSIWIWGYPKKTLDGLFHGKFTMKRWMRTGGTPCVPWYPCFRKPLSGNFEQQKLSDGGRNDMELWSPGSYQGFKWAFQELMVRWAVFFDSLIVGLYVFYNQL